MTEMTIITAPITVTIAMLKIWGKHWQWTSLLGAGVFMVLMVVMYLIKYAPATSLPRKAHFAKFILRR